MHVPCVQVTKWSLKTASSIHREYYRSGGFRGSSLGSDEPPFSLNWIKKLQHAACKIKVKNCEVPPYHTHTYSESPPSCSGKTLSYGNSDERIEIAILLTYGLFAIFYDVILLIKWRIVRRGRVNAAMPPRTLHRRDR